MKMSSRDNTAWSAATRRRDQAASDASAVSPLLTPKRCSVLVETPRAKPTSMISQESSICSTCDETFGSNTNNPLPGGAEDNEGLFVLLAPRSVRGATVGDADWKQPVRFPQPLYIEDDCPSPSFRELNAADRLGRTSFRCIDDDDDDDDEDMGAGSRGGSRVASATSVIRLGIKPVHPQLNFLSDVTDSTLTDTPWTTSRFTRAPPASAPTATTTPSRPIFGRTMTTSTSACAFSTPKDQPEDDALHSPPECRRAAPRTNESTLSADSMLFDADQ